jgi:peptidyl-prolyl cis-trans isomerase C
MNDWALAFRHTPRIQPRPAPPGRVPANARQGPDPRLGAAAGPGRAWAVLPSLLAAGLLVGAPAFAAEPLVTSAAALFGDEILAEGQGVKVTRAQLDEAMIAFKANVAAQGRAIRPDLHDRLETQMLDRLIATQLFLARATDADKTRGREVGEKFLAELKENAGSEQSFQRQLLTTGMTYEQLHRQLIEQAIVREVIDREIKAGITISDEQIRQYYEANSEKFQQPERARVSHILLATRDPLTGRELGPEAKEAKRKQIEDLAQRARRGEDFAALVKEFSEDPAARDNNGEYTIARAKDDPANAMVPEFERAAFALRPGAISDPVTTPYGYHVLKLHEILPARKLPLAEVKDQIHETLLRLEVEKQLEPYVEKLRREAGVKVHLPRGEPPG